MDPQGFAPQGLAAPKIGGAARGAHGAAVGGRPNMGGKVGSLENRTIENYKKTSIDDQAIGVLSRMKNFGTALIMPGWITLPFIPLPLPVPMIAGPLLARLGVKSAPGFMQMAFHAPIEALQKTSLSEWHQTGANIAHEVAHVARQSEGAAQRVAAPAERLAARLGGYGARIGEHTGAMTGTFGATVSHRVQGFGNTAMGAQVERGMGRYATWQMARQEAKHARALAKAQAALTSEAPGFFTRLRNMVSGVKPANTAVASEFSGAMHHVRSGNLHEGVATLKTVLDSKELPKDMVRQGEQALRHLTRAANAGAVAEGFKQSAGRGLQGVLGAMGKSLGRTSIFSALFGATVVAGAGAMMLMSRKQNHAAKETLQEMEQALGRSDHPVLLTAKKLERGERRGRLLNTAVSTAGESMLISGASPGLIMGTQMLPVFQAHRLIFKENGVLNAYAILREAEKGALQLNDTEKAMHMRKLIGAMPEAAAHGGEYNKCAAGMAQHLVEQNASLRDVMQLLGNQEKFVALAGTVSKQQQAAKSAAANRNPAPAAAKTGTAASDAAAAKTAAMPQAAAPLAKINATTAANDGVIDQRQKVLA